MLWTAPRRVESLSLGIVFLGASRWPPQIVIRYALEGRPLDPCDIHLRLQ
jgi:hypothetical protein